MGTNTMLVQKRHHSEVKWACTDWIEIKLLSQQRKKWAFYSCTDVPETISLILDKTLNIVILYKYVAYGKNCHFLPEDANISSMGAHILLKHLDLLVRIYLVVVQKIHE